MVGGMHGERAACAINGRHDSGVRCLSCFSRILASEVRGVVEAYASIDRMGQDGSRDLGVPFMKSNCEFIVVGWLKGVALQASKGQGRRPHLSFRCPIGFPLSRTSAPSAKACRATGECWHSHLCPDGGRVLDPFAGSFSTEAACDTLGLECTSIEWGEELSPCLMSKRSCLSILNAWSVDTAMRLKRGTSPMPKVGDCCECTLLALKALLLMRCGDHHSRPCNPSMIKRFTDA